MKPSTPDEDDHRQRQDEQVEVEDVLGLLGRRLGRQHAAGEQPMTSTTTRRRSAPSTSGPGGLHQLVLAAPHVQRGEGRASRCTDSRVGLTRDTSRIVAKGRRCDATAPRRAAVGRGQPAA